MKKIRMSTNFTVFLLFFGVSVFEAFQTRNWLLTVFWLLIAIGFLAADNIKETK